MEKIEIEKSLADGYFNSGIKKPLQIFLEIRKNQSLVLLGTLAATGCM